MSPQLQLDGRPLAFEKIPGAPPTLVFLHEALGSVRQWKDFPAALCAKTGRAGFVYDRLGHGGSAPFAAPRTARYLHDEALESLPRVLDAAGLKDRVILIGHSDGGTIALLFAAAFPRRVAGLIVEAAHVYNDDFTREGVRSTVAAAETGPLKKLLERHHGEKTEALFRAWHETWLGPQFADWDVRPELSKVAAPTLAIQGEGDKYGTVDQLAAIADGVRRGESFLVPGCGHAPHHEQRAMVLEHMAAFVSRLS